jgi:hypothetical protein
MANIGDSFKAKLKDVHLGWGIVSKDGTRHRDPYEAYIPLKSKIATKYDLINDGTEFNVTGQDFKIKFTGKQHDKIHGKNLSSSGDLTLLGKYLKDDLELKPGDAVKVKFVSENEVSINKL